MTMHLSAVHVRSFSIVNRSRSISSITATRFETTPYNLFFYIDKYCVASFQIEDILKIYLNQEPCCDRCSEDPYLVYEHNSDDFPFSEV